MAIQGGKSISGLTDLNPLVGTEDFVVRSATNNFRLNYSTLLTKISGDLTVSNTMTTEGDMLYYTGGNNTRLPIGTEDQFLRVSSGVPVWETVAVLSDPTTTNGDIITKSSGVLDRIGVGTEGQVLTVSSGAPAWSDASSYSDPLTTDGDLIVRTGGVTSRLAVGSNDQILKVVAGEPAWSAPDTTALASDGDILIYNSGEVALNVGSEDQFLRVSGGFPVWESVSFFTDPLTTDGDLITRTGGVTGRLAVGTNNQVLSSDGIDTVWNDITSLVSINDFLPLSGLAQSPTLTEDGYVLFWDNSSSQYDLKAEASNSYTFQDGLQESLGVASFGGTSTSDLSLSMDDLYNFNITNGNQISLESGSTGNHQTNLIMDSTSLSLFHSAVYESSNAFRIDMDSSAGTFLITDGINFRGIEYASASYQDNFTNESLVTRRWVDGKFQEKIPLSPTAEAPSAGQDGQILFWDNSNSYYDLKSEAGAGAVTAIGLPVNNQLAVWTGSTTVEGDSNLTFNGSQLSVTGEIQVDNINLNGNTLSTTNTNGDFTVTPNGTGNVILGNFSLDADQSVGAGQDDYVLTYDNGTGLISLEPSASAALSNISDDTGNSLLIGDASTSGDITISAQGSDVTVDIDMVAQGAAGVFRIGDSASANRLVMSSSQVISDDSFINIGASGTAYFRVRSTRIEPASPSVMLGDNTTGWAEATITDIHMGEDDSTGTTRTIDAVGTEANIDIDLVPKGTGDVLINGVAISTPTPATHTPSYSNQTNVSSNVSENINYYRTGDAVHMWGEITITPTASATNTILEIDLPVSSNFADTGDAGGSGAVIENSNSPGAVMVYGITSTDTIRFIFDSQSTNNHVIRFSVTYVVI